MSNNDIPKISISDFIGYGESDSGQNFCIEMIDYKGQRVIMHVPHHLDAALLSHLSSAVAFAAKRRGESPSDDVVAAMDVKDIKFGATDDGIIGMRFSLASGIEMNLALDATAQQDFSDALSRLKDYRSAGGPTRIQ